jgi:hypothetical protein
MPWPVASRTMKHPGRSNMRQGRGKRVACWPGAASISRAPDKRPRPHGVCTCARASAGLPGGASPDTELSILPEVPSFHRPIQRGILLFSMKFSGRVPGQSARGPQRSGRRPSPRSSPTNRPLDPRPEARRRRPNADLAPNVCRTHTHVTYSRIIAAESGAVMGRFEGRQSGTSYPVRPWRAGTLPRRCPRAKLTARVRAAPGRAP